MDGGLAPDLQRSLIRYLLQVDPARLPELLPRIRLIGGDDFYGLIRRQLLEARPRLQVWVDLSEALEPAPPADASS